MELAALEERLGYTFAQHALLEQAVTHRSHGAVHNERLEFLGDAVLNCAVAHLLFAKYARLDEGDLSRLRTLISDGALELRHELRSGHRLTPCGQREVPAVGAAAAAQGVAAAWGAQDHHQPFPRGAADPGRS